MIIFDIIPHRSYSSLHSCVSTTLLCSFVLKGPAISRKRKYYFSDEVGVERREKKKCNSYRKQKNYRCKDHQNLVLFHFLPLLRLQEVFTISKVHDGQLPHAHFSVVMYICIVLLRLF